MQYPVLKEVREEEKLFGFVLSMRQAAYLIGTVIGCWLTTPMLYRFIRHLTDNVPLSIVIAFLFVMCCLCVAAIFMFVPAGFMGLMPGPKHIDHSDTQTPPIQLDAWLLMLFQHRNKEHRLPYRRQ